MEHMCIVNKDGKLVENLNIDREPIDGEFKVSMMGYYERLNDDKYPDARYDFDIKDWVGVGVPRPLPSLEPNSDDYLLELDYRLSKLEMGV